MGVRNIDHEELINNMTGLIKTAVMYDLPIIFSHVGVGLNGSQRYRRTSNAYIYGILVQDGSK